MTPHIDELSRAGVILSDYHTFKFCSPSRTQLLTGRYAYHVGQQTGLNLNPSTGCEKDSTQAKEKKFMCTVKCGVPLEYKMLPHLLKTRGYRTHALGMWPLRICVPAPGALLTFPYKLFWLACSRFFLLPLIPFCRSTRTRLLHR
jgi:arylsulfatase I/J